MSMTFAALNPRATPQQERRPATARPAALLRSLALAVVLAAASLPAAPRAQGTAAPAAEAARDRAQGAQAGAAASGWGAERIAASRVLHLPPASLPARPTHAADPLNLFVVVEGADHHVSIVDGDRLEPIARFATRGPLAGEPAFSPEGRFVYLASRDGWIAMVDLWTLRPVAEVRAGLRTRNAAASADGRYVLVGNSEPGTLAVLDARDLSPVKVIPAADRKGRGSRVSAVHDAASRKSFVVVLEDVGELWEVSYDDRAEPIYEGLVHDFRMGEGIPIPGKLNPRRTTLTRVLHDLWLNPGHWELLGTPRDGTGVQVVNLDVRRSIASLPLGGLPRPASGAGWTREGRTVLAVPNLKEAAVTVIDTAGWKEIARVPTPGAGSNVGSHERSRHAWADSAMSAAGDTLTLIDKRTLEPAATLRPEPGRTVAQVEFTRDGRRALASLRGNDGALIVFDAGTLEQVRRIPMREPLGAYNVSNRIARPAVAGGR